MKWRFRKLFSAIGLFRILGIELERVAMEAYAGQSFHMQIFLMFPRMSLHCKLVPIQNREYEIGLFAAMFVFWQSETKLSHHVLRGKTLQDFREYLGNLLRDFYARSVIFKAEKTHRIWLPFPRKE